MATLILRHPCVSEFQDGEHGKGNRVHNSTAKSQGSMYRCTVCKGEQPGGSPKDVKKK
jgi:hypothetical protein